jgi:hypothetical protein
MTARVFIHPRCFDGPAQCALESSLIERGFDVNGMCFGPPSTRNHRELVTMVDRDETAMLLERMDGTRFVHTLKPVLEKA